MLNRSAITVRVKQPYIDWIKSLPDPFDGSLDFLNEDTNLYLIPPYENDDVKEAILADAFSWIFEEQLNAWWRIKKDWPKKRTLSMFKEWFEVEFHSMIFDLLDTPISDEPW